MVRSGSELTVTVAVPEGAPLVPATPAVAVTVALRVAVNVTCASPVSEVLAKALDKLPLSVLNDTITPLSAFPLVSMTRAVMVDVPPEEI